MYLTSRAFSTSLSPQIKRIPSLAAIKSVDIQNYAKQKSVQEKEAEGIAKRVTEAANTPVEEEGLIKSFLWGSAKARSVDIQAETSFSQKLMRGKYVHEVVFHDVLPHRSPDYVELTSSVYPKLSADPEVPAQLIGSWRTVIGDMDRFVHIWQYDGYPGFHNAHVVTHQQTPYLEYLNELRSCLRSRHTSIIQEFGFWGGTARPHELGGIFELRNYRLKPGKLADWESQWKKGIEVRRKVMEPVGAWFSQIGPLNHVYHLWQFVDLEQRKIARQKSWELEGWAETTHNTVQLIDKMESTIMVPLPFSPLK